MINTAYGIAAGLGALGMLCVALIFIGGAVGDIARHRRITHDNGAPLSTFGHFAILFVIIALLAVAYLLAGKASAVLL